MSTYDLLDHPEATGKGETGVGQRLHLVLPFMHRVDHVQAAQALVGEVLICELPRDDTGDDPAVLQDAHQSDPS